MNTERENIMSTRCQIVVQADAQSFVTPDQDGLHPVYIYKHSDGYPRGVMPILGPLIAHFNKTRGADAPYLVAQIVRAFAVADFQHDAKSTQSMIGWGLDNSFHGDVEFIYYIKASKTQGYEVEIRKPSGDFGGLKETKPYTMTAEDKKASWYKSILAA